MKVAVRRFVALMGVLVVLWTGLLPAEANRTGKPGPPGGNSRKPSVFRNHLHEVPRKVIIRHILAAGEKRISKRSGVGREVGSKNVFSLPAREGKPGLDFGNESGFRIGTESRDANRSHSRSVEPPSPFLAELNELEVRELIDHFARTGVPAKHAVKVLKEKYLRLYLKILEEPRPDEVALLPPEFRKMAEKNPDEAIHTVETVYITLLTLAGEEGEAERLQELGAPEPLLAKRIPLSLKESIGEIPVSTGLRWTILGDLTVDTMKYLKNNKYRDSKKEVSYQDHVQPSDSVQRGRPSRRPRAQDIREWKKSGDNREWLARNATERQRLVLEDLSRGELYSWIAKKHKISTKTIQRIMSGWNMVFHGTTVEKQQYTEEFKAFIFKNGSDRQRRIMIALSENKTHSYIAEKEQCSTKTILRTVLLER